jgi:hypothetical protein
MSLKWLNLDRIRPIAGRPQLSALVCSVDNKSSFSLQSSDTKSPYFPNCRRVVGAASPIAARNIIQVGTDQRSSVADDPSPPLGRSATSEFSENGSSRRSWCRPVARDERITVAIDAGMGTP